MSSGTIRGWEMITFKLLLDLLKEMSKSRVSNLFFGPFWLISELGSPDYKVTSAIWVILAMKPQVLNRSSIFCCLLVCESIVDFRGAAGTELKTWPTNCDLWMGQILGFSSRQCSLCNKYFLLAAEKSILKKIEIVHTINNQVFFYWI